MEEFYRRATQGRTEWWRYILTLVLGCVFGIVGASVLLGVLMAVHLVSPDIATQLTRADNPQIFYPFIGFIFGGWLLAIAVAARLIQRKGLDDIIGTWRWPLYAAGFAVWLVVQISLTLIDVLIAPSGFSFTAGGQTASLALVALLPLTVQTFAEEFIFRGYLTQAMLLLFRREVPAAVASGFLFALVHIPNGLPQTLNAFVLGVVCALIAIRTGGIAFTAGLHLANNYFGAVIVVSGSDVLKGSPGLFAQNTPGLIWWDVGLASIATTAMLLPVWRSKLLLPRL